MPAACWFLRNKLLKSAVRGEYTFNCVSYCFRVDLIGKIVFERPLFLTKEHSVNRA